MTSIDSANINSIMATIGASLAADLSHMDFVDFGMMTSHIYRAKFFGIINKLVANKKIEMKSVAYIIYMATLVKNKRRILEGLTKIQSKYGSNQWYKDTVMFYTVETVQFVSEAEKTGKFPVVNLPSCMPNIACHFLKLNLKGNGAAMSDADLYKKFSQNLFFVQMNIEPDLVAEQMQWESNFWNSTVTTSNNPDRDRYQANKGFNSNFFNTKAADNYKWLVNGVEVDQVYSKDMIIAWLKA
jgi:hypothetical protein